jgi:hypothetical protein
MRGRMRSLTAALAVSLLVGSFAFAAVLDRPETDASGTTRTFRVRGNVHGLYPGVNKKMKLHVRNRYDFPIRVLEVRVHVKRPFVGCPAKAVKVRPWHGKLKIPPHGGRVIHVHASMRRWAPNACQGARFPIRYRGRAVKVVRT